MNFFTKRNFYTLAFLLIGGIAFGQTPFYTEDFADELPTDWTAIEVAGDGMTASNWMWTNVGPTGAFAVSPLSSFTAGNGWMIFDSDLNCSGNQDVWLMSPKMDFTGRDIVQLQFETLYARYGDTITLEVSTDSANWTTLPILSGTENNTFGDGNTIGAGPAMNPQLVTIDMTAEAANQAEFWFAFHFRADDTNPVPMNPPGCGYAWQIDDLALFDESLIPDYDLVLGDVFYTPASFAQPVTQVATDTFGFFADVSNVGTTDVLDVTLRAQVLDNGGAVLYETSVNIDTVYADSPAVTVDVPGNWGPDVPVGNYSLNYDLFVDGETDPTPNDNATSQPWLVTADLWSKENAPTVAYRPGGGPSDWLIGNLYTTSANLVEDYDAIEATFFATKNAGDGNLAGDIVDIILLEVNDDEVDPGWNTFDDNLDYISNPGLIIKSINPHTFTTNNTQGEESTILVDFDDEQPGVLLKPGTRYFLCAEYKGDNNVIFHGFSEDIDYFQISTVVYSDTWFLGGFGVEPAATLRLRIELEGTTDAVGATLPDEALNFYPNPASDVLNVELKFDEPEIVNVTLAQLDGSVIMIDELVNITQANQQYDVSRFPAGTYIVRVATEKGTKTKKFVVAR